MAVFVDEFSDGNFDCYVHNGQHVQSQSDYISENCLGILKPKKTALYKELVNTIGYDLVVVDSYVAEDIMGIPLADSEARKERQKPEDFDLPVEEYEG